MTNRIVWKFFGAFTVLTLIVVFVLNFFVGLELADVGVQRLGALVVGVQPLVDFAQPGRD